MKDALRRRTWLAAAVLTVATLTTGTGVATAAPAEPKPVNCPSLACQRVYSQWGTQFPQDVALDGKGNAYVTESDSSSGVLRQVDLNSGKVTQTVYGFSWPKGIAVDGRTAYVTESSTNSIVWSVDLDTGTKTKLATGVDGYLAGIALDGQGSAYVGSLDTGTLWKIDLWHGRKTKVATGLGKADGVALDLTRNTAYVTDDSNNKLWAVDLSTGHAKEVATNLPGYGKGLALNADHTKAYVTDEYGRKLIEVDLKTGRTAVAATGINSPRGVVLDDSGNAYVADLNGLLKVNNLDESTPPNPEPGGVEVKQVEGVTAVPGKNAVPKVTVTNKSDQRIGRQDVTLHLGPGGLHWLGWQSVYTPRDGGREEFKCSINPNDRDEVLCKDVDLNLDPGESIELRTIVGTYDWLKPCEVPRVNFKIGKLGAADANFVMKDKDGNPPTCPEPH